MELSQLCHWGAEGSRQKLAKSYRYLHHLGHYCLHSDQHCLLHHSLRAGGPRVWGCGRDICRDSVRQVCRDHSRVRGHVNIRWSQWHPAHLIQTVLCRSLQWPDAGDPLHDPSQQTHSSTSRHLLRKEYENIFLSVKFLLKALLSMIYLTSSDIYALINYTGFATWVSKQQTVN